EGPVRALEPLLAGLRHGAQALARLGDRLAEARVERLDGLVGLLEERPPLALDLLALLLRQRALLLRLAAVLLGGPAVAGGEEAQALDLVDERGLADALAEGADPLGARDDGLGHAVAARDRHGVRAAGDADREAVRRLQRLGVELDGRVLDARAAERER